MSEKTSGDAEPRNRRVPDSRLAAPRASRTTQYRRKSPTKAIGGVHRRRNKHWNW